MSQAAVNRAARKAQRQRQFGAQALCARCGWDQLDALSRLGNEILCYECLCIEKGKATVERHHILGRANDPQTVGIPANLHRALSDGQQDWPETVRRNVNRDPLLWIAGLACSLRDLLAWLLDHCDDIIRFLVELAGTLRGRHGATWWEDLGIAAPWAVTT